MKKVFIKHYQNGKCNRLRANERKGKVLRCRKSLKLTKYKYLFLSYIIALMCKEKQLLTQLYYTDMGRLRRYIDVIEYSVSKKFRLVKIFPQESFHLMNKNLYHRMFLLTISNKNSGEFWFVCFTRKIKQK